MRAVNPRLFAIFLALILTILPTAACVGTDPPEEERIYTLQALAEMGLPFSESPLYGLQNWEPVEAFCLDAVAGHEGAVAEPMLTAYFPITAEWLRGTDNFVPAFNAYRLHYGGRGVDMRVVDWRENTDGTLSLQIDYMMKEEGIELISVSVLTVRPDAGGGFQFISNAYTYIGVDPSWD